MCHGAQFRVIRKRCSASGWIRNASSSSCFMGCHSCNGCLAVNMRSNSKINMGGFYEASDISCYSGGNAGRIHYLLCSNCCRGVPGVAGPCSKSCWHFVLQLALQVCTPTRLPPLWPATPPVNIDTNSGVYTKMVNSIEDASLLILRHSCCGMASDICGIS